MWRTAEKRFVPHVCSRNPFAKTFDSWRDQRVRKCELLSRDPKFAVLARSKQLILMPVTVIILFTFWFVVSKAICCGILQKSAPCFHVTTATKRNEQMSRFPTRSLRSLSARQHAPSAHHYGCIMPIPSLQLQKKKPVSCREAMGLVMELWSPRFVTYNTVIDCVKDLDYKRYYYWLCSQLWHNVTAANQWTNLSNSELEVGVAGLSAAHLWKKLNQCRKEICSTCLSVCLRNPCLVWNLSLHCLPEAWGPWEPQYAPTVLHCACIMPIPSLQLQKKDQSHAEKQRVWSRSCGLETKNCCKESF